MVLLNEESIYFQYIMKPNIQDLQNMSAIQQNISCANLTKTSKSPTTNDGKYTNLLVWWFWPSSEDYN